MNKEENKQVDGDFIGNSAISFCPSDLANTLHSINNELAIIDELLFDAGVESIQHIDQTYNIEYSVGMLFELLKFSDTLETYSKEHIDKPLFKNFNLRATEDISKIKVEDFSTRNSLGIMNSYYDQDGQKFTGPKENLRLSDFIGPYSVNGGAGLSNVPSEFTDFSKFYVNVYNQIKEKFIYDSGKPIPFEAYLKQLTIAGEFNHKKNQPFAEAFSNLLDLTIIKPLFEVCIGEDLITGEDLADFERGMKVVGAVVDVISFGQSGIIELPAELAIKRFGMQIGIEVVSNQMSYWTGYACNEMKVPMPLTLLFAIMAGKGTSDVLQDAFFDESVEILATAGAEVTKLDDITELKNEKFSRIASVANAKEYDTSLYDYINEKQRDVNIAYEDFLRQLQELEADASIKISYGTNDMSYYLYNMVENPGPLADIRDNPAKNFFGGRYNVEILSEDRIYYRGGQNGKPLGQWFTSLPPESVTKVRIDTAVKEQWISIKTGELEGKSVVDTVYAVKIPKGTKVYTGPVGPQGGTYCGGYDFNQTFIEEPWKIKGVEIISAHSLN